MEAFKAEGLFRSFWGKISESSVTPHTPGIIPSVYLNRHYGRVLFYDFAGDPEYCSSHAAILENLASSKTGKNLIVIVVDLRGDEVAIRGSLHYWISFIILQRFATKLSFVLVGSHSDSIPLDFITQKKGILEDFAKTISLPTNVGCFMVDCRKPRDMMGFQNHTSTMTTHTSQCNISENASLLLGLLEKDFKNVTACSSRQYCSTLGSMTCAYLMSQKNFTSPSLNSMILAYCCYWVTPPVAIAILCSIFLNSLKTFTNQVCH